jgi:dihydrofolate reductase
MKHFKAIAAMSENRVIGQGNRIPWHLPEDFKWFKRTTMGHAVVMGRKTFESIGKPLPQRFNLVLSRDPERLAGERPELYGSAVILNGPVTHLDPAGPSLLLLSRLDQIVPARLVQEIFICGGAQLYEQALPYCSDLYLTLVKKIVEGDAFFPAFEERFRCVATLLDGPEFEIRQYRNEHPDVHTAQVLRS